MRIFMCLIIVFMIFSTSQAEIYLKDINVSKHGDSVCVEITTSKPCLYEHFMIKKAPEKIVVDIQDVVNNWPRKSFGKLPFKSIEKIRTSQFQITPNLITRVVLDVNRPIGYKVEQLPLGLKITIPVITGEQAFIPWSANKQLPAIAQAVKKTPSNKTAAKPAKAKKKTSQKRKSGIKIESFPKRKLVKYKVGSHRDPFKPLVGNRGSLIAGDMPAIENLSLVGVFDEEAGEKALFEDTEGNGFLFKPGDRVQNGYLVSVRKNKAIFQVTEYGWTRTVALKLQMTEIK
ncbi:MAG: AMIN domain-containing protein [candidate division Zixibacteria bacterium]|nr:AMIN domain-containing protein [candidate division Zixibacteria bacterium]